MFRLFSVEKPAKAIEEMSFKSSLLRQLNRLTRLGPSESQYPSRLYSTRAPLTLDDVLPSTGPTPQSTTANFTPEGIENDNGGFESVPSRGQDRFGSRLQGFTQYGINRRSTIELGADPLKRRSGEKTHYSLIVHSTSNNTRLTLTHTPIAYLPGIVARVTAGTVGFKSGRRQEYEAATQATLAMFNKIRDLLKLSDSNRLNSNLSTVKEGIPRELEIVFNGFGIGRDAFLASLLNSQSTDLREIVRSIRDTTVVKIGGPRPQKRRRV
ncbi:hypothetical protein PSTT_03683 [Puccinia striiformis]|uniref:Uncharacterized protein n=1 Tax=Puccinia striiformis TaxID=27350 RepID=A0A2S4VVF6_9BASI|nr:hypothetical protein PSTT_03683 [Puccinia striiformis]